MSLLYKSHAVGDMMILGEILRLIVLPWLRLLPSMWM